ncbi:DNA-binding protein [Bacillus sp. B15-48]|uniref:DNA-binding protein n=1 Tax=Bacillus sp. B15-48 TaxID=1548601 RepID=UPI00193F4A89|nr:DNA-binding protein [Bacillus sp. B15-48]MBM4764725.1 DNA-binding protein [Bacillus sp. B15-48]
MKKEIPSCIEVIELFKKVLTGETTREKISDWATHYIVNDKIYDIRDKELWKLLDLASGIDLRDAPTEYLHCDEDIRDWIRNYENT